MGVTLACLCLALPALAKGLLHFALPGHTGRGAFGDLPSSNFGTAGTPNATRGTRVLLERYVKEPTYAKATVGRPAFVPQGGTSARQARFSKAAHGGILAEVRQRS